jgi:hypothetical protein
MFAKEEFYLQMSVFADQKKGMPFIVLFWKWSGCYKVEIFV